MLVLSGSIGTSIDCAALVPEPIDVVPIRSAQAIHTAMARRFAGRSLVEIGTRNGDGMSCFAQVASKATAIEMDKKYCAKLTARQSTQAVPPAWFSSSLAVTVKP